MSSAVCMLPLIAGLSFFSQQPWQGINPEQKHFLDHIYPHASSLNKLDPEELQAIASSDVEEVNLFLQKKNFDLTLKPGDQNSIYLASVLNVLFEWGFEGAMVSSLRGQTDQQEYPAVLVSNPIFFEVLKVNKYHNREIYKFPAKRPGDYLYISCAQQLDTEDAVKRGALEAQNDGFALLKHVRNIHKQLRSNKCMTIKHAVKTITFPMVDINTEMQHEWMQGMTNQGYFINQAVQQIIFTMDEKGAAVSSGFAYEMARCIMKDVVINEPFFVWIKRSGVSTPIFAAYVDEASWKRPVRD